jgi:hypothetical protein
MSLSQQRHSRIGETLQERLAWNTATIGAGEDDCWNWTGSVSYKGYGRIFWEGQYRIAHRMAFIAAYDETPETVDHLCRNRRCVNPRHLDDVSNYENWWRGEGPARQNVEKTHCPKGHPYDMFEPGARRCHECRLVQVRAAYAKRQAKMGR